MLRLPPLPVPFGGPFNLAPSRDVQGRSDYLPFPDLMRKTEGKADAVVVDTVRRRIVATVDDTADPSTAVPAAAAQHAVGARTGPCRVGLR